MIPGKRYTPEDILRIAWRRRWLILLPLALVATATVVVSARLPNVYRSETLILIVPQRVPTEYVRSTVTTRIEDRLQSISQQILSRTRLERIITDLKLYPELRERLVMEDIVERMRTDISVQIVQGADSFRVSYQADDPTTAMKVTERLSALFIDENLRDREVLARGTSEFLESQLEDARQRLVEQEKRLEQYRLAHTGELPTQLQSNLQAIQNTQMQIQSVLDSLNRDRDRKLVVERMIADMRAEDQANAATLPPAAAPVGQETAQATSQETETVPASAPVAVQLDAARRALGTLELRLRPEHPDVVRMKRVIASLEQKLAAEQAATSQRPQSAPAPATATPAEILRGNRLRDLEAELANLDAQITYKAGEEERLRRIVQEYQRRIDAVPTRESELISLTRDYETLQNSYKSLLSKKEDSKIAENMERRQVGEQFKVLDPPRLPERPFKPDRLRINMAGTAGGLILGLLWVGLLEYRTRSLESAADVGMTIGLPVLASIPLMLSPAEQRSRFWRALALSCAGGLTIVGCAAVVAFVLLR